jgi:hypothetical protein
MSLFSFAIIASRANSFVEFAIAQYFHGTMVHVVSEWFHSPRRGPIDFICDLSKTPFYINVHAVGRVQAV